MSAHRIHSDLWKALTGSAKIQPVATGNAVDLDGLDIPVIRGLGAGTFTLPNVAEDKIGALVRIVADGAQTWKNAAGTTRGVLESGETAIAMASTTTDWTMSINPAGLAVEINDAADLPFSDPDSKTGAANVSTALAHALMTADLYNTAITTVGAGTLTAAGIVGGLITRSGSTAAYTDTTATAAQIIAAAGATGTGQLTGTSGHGWYMVIRNTVAFAQTLAAGDSVTLSGNSIIPPNSAGLFLVLINDTADGVTIYGAGAMPQCQLPNGQYATSAAASPVTAAAGVLTGARHVYWRNTTDGALSLTTRTATQMFGDIPNCHIGFTYFLTILQEGDNTITITPGSNVTIDVATIATTVARTYLVTFTSATACTFTTVSLATSP